MASLDSGQSRSMEHHMYSDTELSGLHHKTHHTDLPKYLGVGV